MSDDQTYRDRVYREAIAAGHSEDEAALIASAQGVDTRQPQRLSQRDATPKPLSRTLTGKPQPRASLTTGTAGASLRSVAAMYGPGAVALVPRFAAAGLSTKRVTEMLAAETGNARHLGEIGARRLSYQLDQIGAT